MDRWYRVGVKLHPEDRARYIKGMLLPWHTTSYRYSCWLFRRSVAEGFCKSLNSKFNVAKHEGYAFVEEA